MSVLQRKELEDSPLADLHAIASELGIEGYRALRRDDLVGAILRAQGDEEERVDPVAKDLSAGPAVEEKERPVPPHTAGMDPHPDALPSVDDAVEDAPLDVTEPEEMDEEPPAHELELDPERDAGPVEKEAGAAPADEAPEGEIAEGVLDILPNGSGFVRVDGAGQSGDDVYVSPAQIRRCELRAGDEVAGPVRPPRRSERHPSLVRVATVNGGDAEPPEERPDFADLTPVHPTERLPAPAALDGVPFGKGSRVAVSGGPGAGSTRLLQEIARTLSGTEATLSVVLVGARPEEVTDWQREEGLSVAGGSFDRALEGQIQAVELAVERAKRTVERGGDAVVIVDSLEALPPGPVRRLFGAARKVEEGGSLTVIAAVGSAVEPLRQASTRIALDDAGEAPTVLGPLSGTQRADLLG